MAKELLDAAVIDVIRDLLEREMHRFGLTDVDVTLAPDHDGDPAIRVDARYGDAGQPVDPRVMAGLTTKLRDRLWGLDEQRFPHIRHHFSDRHKVVGFE